MKFISPIILILLLYACAQTTPLGGGPKDMYAPAIDSAKTTPANGELNFKGDRIEMKFTEYISLNNPNDNILIIPQPKVKPEFKVKNKKLWIEFQEPLDDNTTYVLTFNGAIQDITEKNDSVFQYVFSTGDYIDSLAVKGSVKDAFTNQAAQEVLVGLYPIDLEAHFDSIPHKFKPLYLSQTDQTGNFELNYLKGGRYYLFAIKDRDKNLRYDTGEEIAVLADQDFQLSADEIPDFELKLFTEESDKIEIEDLNYEFPGRVEVILSNPTDSFSISSDMGLLQEKTERADSLVFWLERSPASRMKFYTELLGEKDTAQPVYSNIPDNVEEVKLKTTNNVNKGKLLPGETLNIQFSEPIGDVNQNAIHFFDLDSNEVTDVSFEVEVRTLKFDVDSTKARRIIIDSAAVTSVFERELQDRIELKFENETAQDYYGSLILAMDTTFNESVIVELLDTKNKVVADTSFAKEMRFEQLLPGDYQLRLIFDVDKNGEWTTGSLSEAREPEKVVYNTETIKVKSKWEKEVDWILSPGE